MVIKKNPTSLRSDPIIEAIFEVRFRTNDNLPAADLLPGFLYPQLKDRFPIIESLPTASFQREIAKQDPSFRYKPSHRMVGISNQEILIGDNSVTFSCKRPYPGWRIWKPQILDLINYLEATQLVTEIERFSIKYVNVLPRIENTADFCMLKFKAHIGGYDLSTLPTHIRTEIRDSGFVNVIQMIPDVESFIAGQESIKGLLLDIDTIWDSSILNNWQSLPELLERSHETEKKLFFSMLTEVTINHFEPIWE